MPTVNEVGDFPADTLWYFRRAVAVHPGHDVGVDRRRADRAGRPAVPGRGRRAQRARAGRQPVITPPSTDVAARGRGERLAGLATPPGRARAAGRARRLAGGDPGRGAAAAARQRPAGDLRRRPRRGGARRLGVPARDHRARWSAPSSPGRPAVRRWPRRTASRVRVLDLGVDDDLADVPADVRRHKVRRSSGADPPRGRPAPDGDRQAPRGRAAVAQEEIAAGAQLLLSGDMGIGNTTPAAALVAAGARAAGQRGHRPRHRHRRRRAGPQEARRRAGAGPRRRPRRDDPVETPDRAGQRRPGRQRPATSSRPPRPASRCCSTA